ncbi:CAAX protease [Pediococcus damnosus LMG 28219]|uniref:CPBP family intramembrane glutamic endopeptidase n=1 Tax=Pediococcus damnosus TaxID=51663 RepID=UPI00061EC031|nr:type II CAAX endopeptidase family protein [Pediococcus damnosus]AMV60055.1 CAAX amino terminal protease family protein [Pediococcus damnosus]AMV64299.1 CAAX amino terminal protease family protein [Pediococcus damnosus]AMV69123.1 CAAX amino terminal protease family protein [Pediococcus damnosus]KJU73416.1 CAAX protease [Pediococcus damnosus LMG 28219]PIO80928.1 CPBP family intramembrane metalloprotease [Pediococcus damnosus]
MKLEKKSIYILITYLIVYLLPSILNSFFKLTHPEIFNIQIVDYLAGACILCYLAFHDMPTNLPEKRRRSVGQNLIWGILGFIFVIVLQTIILRLTVQSGGNASSQNTTDLLSIVKNYPIYALIIIIGAPIMEEIVFRKVLFGNLANLLSFINPKVAQILTALISSGLFALAHSDGHFILYGAIGLWFCWLYHHTGRIQTSMMAHILMNSLVVLPILGL